MVDPIKFRKYGNVPYRIALIHGGPGGAGTLAPLAKEMNQRFGVGILESLQTTSTVENQVKELKNVLKENTELPVILLGHSWGAMLSYIFAAEHPSYVKKLIMVGSGVFEHQYAKDIQATRINRMPKEKQLQLKKLLSLLSDGENLPEQDEVFHQLGQFFEIIDSYDPIQTDEPNTDHFPHQYYIYQHVWPQVERMRKSGQLIALAKNIQCPVLAIHGEYDPHPYQGIEKPLAPAIKNFRFVLLKNCGHEPWIEQQAREQFWEIMKNELVV